MDGGSCPKVFLAVGACGLGVIRKESGGKVVADYRLPWRKRLFAHTQTIVCLYAKANAVFGYVRL